MRIVVAMSGGVDSSVAAALLADAGHEVIGLSMQLYDASGDRHFGSCCSIDDLHDARRVAQAIGIPHYIMNFERQFEEQVIGNFVSEYASGRTPLPCAHCNSDLKFATLADRAHGLGADAVATGHYARVDFDSGANRYLLRRGVDSSKDQAYFLFSLTQEQLARACFPVGNRDKDAVREYARDRGLPVADKPDSQEICFIPDHDYKTFVERQIATQSTPETTAAAEGRIVDEAGHVLGSHDGIHRFTVGQRKGLNLSSQHARGTTAAAPRYVIAIRPDEREVVVGPRASLERRTLTTSNVNWIVARPDAPVRALVQIRHRHLPAAATVRAMENERAAVEFDVPQSAVAPGQAAVFFDGDLVLGGGWID